MREHPIIFSGPMIRAILEGRKTMTRRLAKNAPENWGQVTKMSNPGSFMLHFNRGVKQVQCPYGQPGDHLWVREAWRETGVISAPYAYRAIDEPLTLVGESGSMLALKYRWRPSIHMPRKASRLILEITDIRIEWLRDISEEDSRAEGVIDLGENWDPFQFKVPDTECSGSSPRAAFFSLWDSIHKSSGHRFVDNPTVWVITFEVVK